MTDTNQLPPLPDFLSDTNSINAFVESTDEQIRDAFRAYALQARAQVHPAQAEVTDEQILEVLRQHWDALKFARGILALRPVQVPMTREQAMAIVQSNPDTMTAIRMTEAHHGITAQAKKEDK